MQTPPMIEVELRVLINGAPADFLNRSKSGDKVAIWSKDESDKLFFYEKGSVGGAGLIGAFFKEKLPLLAIKWPEASAYVSEIGLTDCVVTCHFNATDDQVALHVSS